MKKWTILNVLWVTAATGLTLSEPAAASRIQAWGLDSNGQVSAVPTGNTFTAIAAGDAYGLGLRSDGTIAAWGQNADGQRNVPAGTYRYVACGSDFSLAIRSDGSLAAWGKDTDGQVSKVPAGNNYVAVDGGLAFAVALKSDGSLVAWGNDRWSQVSKVPTGTDFKAVAVGDCHGVALRLDGTLTTWGYSAAIQNPPTDGPFTAISAGGTFCVAIRSNGSLVWWGTQSSDYGLDDVPAGNDYVAVSAGYLHCIALKKDGSLVGWGAGTDSSVSPHWGQAACPAGKDYTAIAAGLYHSLALTEAAIPDTNDNTTPPTGACADDFDDNQRGSLWKVQASHASTCWLQEVNSRLELRATAQADTDTAYYMANNWAIDPSKDFSFRITFHYGLSTNPLGWVSVGLTPDANNIDGQHLEFGPGCGDSYSHLWYEAVDKEDGRSEYDYADRSGANGTLFVSYNATLDELYLSTSGYGAGPAWKVVSGLLQGTWLGRPIWLYLGGGSDGQVIASGDAYLDTFAMDSGNRGTGGNTIPVPAGCIDDFDDDQRGSLWNVQAIHSSTCWLQEVNSRLELRATAQADADTAYYIADNWTIDPSKDFSCKIGFHYGLKTSPLGWVSVGLTPDANNIDGQHLEFGPGCGDSYSHLWYEAVDTDAKRSDYDFADRSGANGMLYVSYNAALDELYLGTSGYGADAAWKVVSGLLQGTWAGRPIRLYLGGGSDGQEIASGDAYLDTLVMSSGGPAKPALSPVYRFWAPSQSAHFYTIDPNEKEYLIKVYSNFWVYEGVAFQAATAPGAPGLAPVYRFWSPAGLGHFYTIDPVEMQTLLDKYPKVWTFEKIAFYAYPVGSQPPLSKPVYRFWQPKQGTHFYTINPAEKNFLLQNYSTVYTSEGIAFYTFE